MTGLEQYLHGQLKLTDLTGVPFYQSLCKRCLLGQTLLVVVGKPLPRNCFGNLDWRAEDKSHTLTVFHDLSVWSRS